MPASHGPAAEAEVVDAFRELGVTAFTTGRAAGSFGTQSDEAVRDVMARWGSLRSRLGVRRLATAAQVHGSAILEHDRSSITLLPSSADLAVVTILICKPMLAPASSYAICGKMV